MFSMTEDGDIKATIHHKESKMQASKKNPKTQMELFQKFIEYALVDLILI